MIAANRGILGDYVAAQADVDRSIAVLTEIGDVWNLSFALMVAAGIATHLGEFGKVLDYTTRSLDLARQIAAGRQTM